MKKFNVEELLKDERYRKQILQFRTETLRLIVNNQSKAENYTRKTIKKLDPANLNNDYIQKMVKEMQKLAKMVLEKRTAKK